MNRIGRIATWSAAGVVAIGGIAGVAYAAAPAPSAGPVTNAAVQTFTADNAVSEETSPERLRRGLHRFGAHGLHGEFIVQTKQGETKTVAVQRGEVTAVDAESVTVTSVDGFKQTWTLTETTRVRKNGEQADVAALAVGDWVGVIGEKSDDTLIAAGIRVPKDRPKAAVESPSSDESGSGETGSLGRVGGRDTADEIAFLASAAANYMPS
jgi:Domain of unknown function (DUF5666)